MSLTPGQISAVIDLFKDENEGSDSDEDKPVSGTVASLGPGSIGPSKNASNNEEASKGNEKDIWAEAEVPEGSEFDSLHDPRPQPEYDIFYSQSVTSEDMFLQMGNKTPMTASCESMTVKIKLPDTKLSEIELDVKSKFLDCRCPGYKLGLHLPHPVDSKTSKAQWDNNKQTLIVSLHLNREYDMFNF